MLAGIPQPPRLADVPEQGLHHGQGDQLGVGDLWGDAAGRSPRRPFRRGLQQIIGTDIEFGSEGVKTGSTASSSQGNCTRDRQSMLDCSQVHLPIGVILTRGLTLSTHGYTSK